MLSRLRAIPGVTVSEQVPLSECTRFAIGGPARVLIDVPAESALAAVLGELRESGSRVSLIGGGTNLIVSDDGFPGAVLRYTASCIESSGKCSGLTVHVESGAILQDLVDFTISAACVASKP